MTADLATISWRDRAACRGADTELFYPLTGGAGVSTALALCGNCPVWDDCLTTALKRAERGIWGGTTEEQRRRIRSGKEPRPTEPPEVTVTVHAINPPATSEPVGIVGLEQLLRRAEQSNNPATRKAGEKVREAVEDIRQRINAEAAEARVRAEIADLEKQLAAKQEKLRTLRPAKKTAPTSTGLPDGATHKDVRAWAKENNVDCPPQGRVPAAVIEQYKTAHGLAS